MHNFLKKHFIKILMIPALAAVSVVIVYYSFLKEAELNNQYMRLSGYHYDRIEKLYSHAQQIVNGHNNQAKLRQSIYDYDHHLNIFHQGGTYLGVHLPPVSGALLININQIGKTWKNYKDYLTIIANSAAEDSHLQDIFFALTDQKRFLKEHVRSIFSLLQSQHLRTHQELFWLLVIIEFTSFALLYLGIQIARKYLNEKFSSEEALQVSEERFNRIIRATHDGIWYWDVDKNQIYFSPRWNEILGYGKQESIRDFIFFQSIIHTDDLGHVLDDWIRCIEGESNSFHTEYRLKNNQGTYVWLQSRGRVVRENNSGPGFQLIGADTDLSDQRQMEKNLNRVVVQLQHTLDNSPSIIYRASSCGGFIINFVSENMFRVLGYKSRAILGDVNFWNTHIHPDDKDAVVEKLKHLEHDLQQVHEYRFLNANNHYCWIHDTMRMIFDEENKSSEIIGSMMDISNRKKMEQALRNEKEEQKQLVKKLQDAQGQLLQSEKMASLGQLAAGVAHEINNPVGFVSSNLGSLKSYVNNLIEMIQLYVVLEPNYVESRPIAEFLGVAKNKLELDYIQEDIKSLIDESLDGVVRVKRIVQDLKNFSHVDDTEMHWGDLEQGIESTLNIVWNELKYKVEIVREFSNIPQIECAISQLNQVIMNLLVNAGYAIKEKGKIFIRTGLGKTGWVWVEIEDTGEGIEENKLRRIFDPFFTTKPVGKGTGLGLSLSFGIVENHGGRFEVESEPGKGTLFRIHLPIQQEKVKESKKETHEMNVN